VGRYRNGGMKIALLIIIEHTAPRAFAKMDLSGPRCPQRGEVAGETTVCGVHGGRLVQNDTSLPRHHHHRQWQRVMEGATEPE